MLNAYKNVIDFVLHSHIITLHILVKQSKYKNATPKFYYNRFPYGTSTLQLVLLNVSWLVLLCAVVVGGIQVICCLIYSRS